MIEVIHARVIKNEKIYENNYHIILELPINYPGSEPGQFVNIYLNNDTMILPRPLSIFDHCNGELHLIYAIAGEGTCELSSYNENVSIRISTPLGNGYTIPEYIEDKDYYKNSILLIGGGMGIAPLHYFAVTINKIYAKSGHRSYIYAVLGYKNKPFLNHYFKDYCYEIQSCSENGHDGCWFGNVMIPVVECEYFLINNWFACGPYPMQKALSEYAAETDIINFQVSLEERMGCGFGTCVGCSINVKDNNGNGILRKKVCRDGPVFKGNEVIWK